MPCCAKSCSRSIYFLPSRKALTPIVETGRDGESASASGSVAERSAGVLAAQFCAALAADDGGAAKVYAWVEKKKAKRGLRKPKEWTLSPSDAREVRRVVLAALIRHGIAGSSSSSSRIGGGDGAVDSIVGGPALAARLDAIAESASAGVVSALEDDLNAASRDTLKELWVKGEVIFVTADILCESFSQFHLLPLTYLWFT